MWQLYRHCAGFAGIVQSSFWIHVSHTNGGLNPPLRPSDRQGSNVSQAREGSSFCYTDETPNGLPVRTPPLSGWHESKNRIVPPLGICESRHVVKYTQICITFLRLFLCSEQDYAYHYHFIICINKAMCLPHVGTIDNIIYFHTNTWYYFCLKS